VIRDLVFRGYRGAAMLAFGRALKAYYPAPPCTDASLPLFGPRRRL
jgi:hypothetical protein